MINLWGLQVPLPIKGSGVFEVLYLDDNFQMAKAGAALTAAGPRARVPRGHHDEVGGESVFDNTICLRGP